MRTKGRFKISLVALLLIVSGSASAQDEDVIQKSFQKGNYPWYDADSDEARFDGDVSDFDSAITANRNEVPEQLIATPTAQNQNTSESASWWMMLIWVGLALLALTVLIALAVWFILKMDPPSGAGSSSEEEEEGTLFNSERVERLPFEMKKTSGDFHAAAEGAYQKGDFRAATTYLFSHVLLTLDRHQMVRLRRGKTNRQYLNELSNGNAQILTPYFERLMTAFESTFFGNHDIPRPKFEECWNALPQFHEQLKQTSGGSRA